jgi:hypothetical protein
VFALLELLFVAAAGSGSPLVTFPGKQRELPSPDAAFTIVWWEPDASKTGHSLLLKAAHTPKSWRVHSFERSVSVSWAPSGHVFVVTDRLGNSTTTFARNAETGTSVGVCARKATSALSGWPLTIGTASRRVGRVKESLCYDSGATGKVLSSIRVSRWR